ncbi:hypothetical protein COV16_02410 [Candidatus Woesearchaeota archaeon CG10_big_fil_rev_8_21_14_0_10_34_8]|nr:MAG: hypothetical protein COV16_02410 [Candidatus Woesearchaeota archaeon CG10_big_fil_rev_8_21_14_0_10_34_8]
MRYLWVILIILLLTACSGEDNATDKQHSINEKTIDNLGFVIDEGYRINFASNPRIMSYEEGILSLGYEYHSQELKNEPSARGYIAFSDDGLNFYDNRKFNLGENKGKGIQLADGTYRRYQFSPDKCGFTNEYSENGNNWQNEDDLAYDLSENDDCWAGVYTTFVDEEGGVVLLYNNDLENEEGKKDIYVRRAYSTDNGKSFAFEGTVIDINDKYGDFMSLADPNAIVLDDGRILLILMNQDAGEPKPPLGRVGDLYGFISEDGGKTFDSGHYLFGWADFDEFEVRSLNDPKILQMNDGSYKIYVAAMIPAEEGDDEENDYKYVIVSATSKTL